jgi:hypothetical protein
MTACSNDFFSDSIALKYCLASQSSCRNSKKAAKLKEIPNLFFIVLKIKCNSVVAVGSILTNYLPGFFNVQMVFVLNCEIKDHFVNSADFE